MSVLLILAFTLAVVYLAGRALKGIWTEGDDAAILGVGGAFGLGILGCLMGLGGLASLAVGYGLAGIGFVAIAALALKTQWSLKTSKPEGSEMLFVLAIGVAVLFALLGALAPSTTVDWDSLAYHMAVPKLWLQMGRVESIPYIHHSNFPSAVDSLFLPGLAMGSQAAAKIVMPVFMVCGVLAIFGLTRERHGRAAAWWAALAFSTVPLVIWESGSAYIDVAHGLFAGLGFIFAARAAFGASDGTSKADVALAVTGLALAAGSKYTGLLFIFIAGFTVLAVLIRRKANLKLAFVIGLGALLLCSPWYVRNVEWKGNPVFPFFYSKFGGRGWDQRRADIYTHQQNTFGVGRVGTTEQPDMAQNPLQPTRLGVSILGLSFTPGRYVDPTPTEGLGFPMGAMGAALLAGFFALLASGRARGVEKALLLACLLTMVAWFGLSQQARYILAIAAPLSLLLGAGIARLALGRVLAAVTALQAAVSIGVLYLCPMSRLPKEDGFVSLVQGQIAVVSGKVSPEDYQKANISFYDAATKLNAMKAKRVILYDEVFGFLLDVPYIWGNPGHSTLIDYDKMETGESLVTELKAQGFSHVYLNLGAAFGDKNAIARYLAACGIGSSQPLTEKEKSDYLSNFEVRYKALLADAASKGLLKPIEAHGGWVLFELP